CSVESAEGVGIGSLCTPLRSAIERIQRWNLARESEDRDHWVDRSNPLPTKSEIIASSEIVTPVLSSDSTEQNPGVSDSAFPSVVSATPLF
ncbi:hypothetical protein, partial [Halorubrum persicum]|uniref:hypothetical protein n=1 Tax=Halorubrum persicum TaxID=1383844 RepID=UPI001C557670